MNQEKRETAINQSFDLGHEAGRNEIFRQLTDVRASQKAHMRKILGEIHLYPGTEKLRAIAVAQLKEIDEYINVLLPAVYKEGGV